MATLKVYRAAYQRAREGELKSYAANVFKSCNGVAAYAPIADEITVLGSKTTIFSGLLDDAEDRDRVVIAEKNAVKAQVIDMLNKVADGLEANAADDPLYIIRAGMSTRKTPERHTAELPPPHELLAQSNGIRGQVLLRFTLHDPAQVLINAVEWKTVNEPEWKNGTYKSGQRIVIEGLPSNKSVIFQVCSLGTRGRKSIWSDPSAPASVL